MTAHNLKILYELAGQWDVTRPYWEHDCDRCEFLGGLVGPLTDYKDAMYGRQDMYYCAAILQGEGTVLSRKSSEPSDYNSQPISWDLISSCSGILVANAILQGRKFWKEQQIKEGQAT